MAEEVKKAPRPVDPNSAKYKLGKIAADAFADAIREIVELGKSNPQALLDAPVTLPVRRMDETAAARQMVLTEDME